MNARVFIKASEVESAIKVHTAEWNERVEKEAKERGISFSECEEKLTNLLLYGSEDSE